MLFSFSLTYPAVQSPGLVQTPGVAVSRAGGLSAFFRKQAVQARRRAALLPGRAGAIFKERSDEARRGAQSAREPEREGRACEFLIMTFSGLQSCSE